MVLRTGTFFQGWRLGGSRMIPPGISIVPAYWASWKLAPTANLRLGLFFEFFKFGGESGPARCKWLSLADDMQRFRPVAVLQSALPDREKPLQTLVDLAVGYGSRQRV